MKYAEVHPHRNIIIDLFEDFKVPIEVYDLERADLETKHITLKSCAVHDGYLHSVAFNFQKLPKMIKR